MAFWPFSEASGHGLDAGVRSRQQLVPDREGFGDHGGEAGVSLGAILNDKTLPLAGALVSLMVPSTAQSSSYVDSGKGNAAV